MNTTTIQIAIDDIIHAIDDACCAYAIARGMSFYDFTMWDDTMTRIDDTRNAIATCRDDAFIVSRVNAIIDIPVVRQSIARVVRRRVPVM